MLDRDFINLQTKELSRLLGCNCLARIYCESPSNSVNDSNEYQRLFGDKGVLMLACMESAWRLQAERIVKIDAKRIGFAIPLASNDFLPWFALGILESGCVHASEKLVVAAGQAVRMRMDLMRQQDAMESASRHMAQVMREQAWLRDLANYTRLEQSRLGIENVGQTIFEPLRRVINAEAVGLIDERGGSSDHRRLRSQCYGAGNWTPDDFMELLRQIEPPEARCVNAYSNLTVQLPNGVVRSAIVAAIPSGDNDSKYLIAINHLEDDNATQRPYFGAHQIGLLHEAALYLASHSSNLRTLMESEQLVLGTLQAMSQAIEARDPYTRGHSDRVAKMAYEIAGQMGLPNSTRQEILLSGVLHDIGKIGVPDAILQKPGKLTDEERLIIEKHPEIGHGILEKLNKLRFALPGVLYHHERWDGNGYPHRLRGEEIPLMARILAVADSFDAMTSSRPYRVGMRLDKTRAIMMEGAGVQWDRDIVMLFWNWLDSQVRSDENEEVIPINLMEETPSNVLEAISCLQNAY